MPVITSVLAIGTLAARPAASASNTGFLYCASDQNGGTLYQSTGSAWVQIAAAVTQTAGSVGAVANAGGAPSLQVGLDAAKPAAGTAGRLYVATDTTIVYEDSGTAWIEVATAAPLWASIVGKPATFAPSAHESTHLSGGSDAIAGLSQSQIAVDAAEAATNDTLAGSLLANLDRLRYQLAQLGTGAWNTLRAMVQLSPTVQQTGTINISGEVQGSDFKPGGVTGASAAARYHAATATGHPTTGTWQVGDIVPDQTGTFWFCTVAGTPGTWVQVGGTGGAGSSTLAGDTDVAIASPVGGQVLGYSSALSKWVNQSQAGVAATTQTAQLGADVTMTTLGTVYDGPSLTLPAGTWLLTGVATFHAPATGGSTDCEAWLWDGTTVLSSGQQRIITATDGSVPLTAIVSPTVTTTYKISCEANDNSTILRAALDVYAKGNTATYLHAIQLSGNPVGQQAPAVRAHSSVNVSIPAAAFTAVALDTTDYDQGTSSAQHSVTANTSRLTCQQSGVYAIATSAYFAANGTGVRGIQILLNGTNNIAETFLQANNDASIKDMLVPCSTHYHLNVGDYIEMYVYQNSGAALNVQSGLATFLSMARIDSGPGAVQPNTKVQLDYALSSDLTPTVSPTTWTDFVSDQTFTVDNITSVVEVQVSGYAYFSGAVSSEASVRIVIDSASSNIPYNISGCVSDASGGRAAVLSGTCVVPLTGLSAGTHTVKVQVYGSGASPQFVCRPATLSNIEFLRIRVLERKQSVSPPSSTPAPAVRCYNSVSISIPNSTTTALTFDTNRVDQGTSTPQHSTGTNTSRLTCQQAGMYQITGNIEYATNGTGMRACDIRLNGSTYIGIQQVTSSADNVTVVACTTLYYLNVGDYVELVAWQDSGGSLNVVADANRSPEFMMVRCDTGALPAYTWQAKTSAYTMVTTDYGGILANATGGAFTVTLPTAVGAVNRYTVKKVDSSANTVTVATQSAQTIDGASTYSLSTQNSAVTVESDGTNWYVQAKV